MDTEFPENVKRKTILFTDLRDIACGVLNWYTANGKHLGVKNPPGRPVPMYALPYKIPKGIRFEAQPAKTVGPVDDWKGWGRIIYDQGFYRTWYLEVNGCTQLGSGSPAFKRKPFNVAVCSAISSDGFRWELVSRCRVKITSQQYFDGVSFFIDPMAPVSQRYKLIYHAGFPVSEYDDLVREYLKRPLRERDTRISWERRAGFYMMTSPDGEHWTSINKPFMIHYGDTDNTVLWDETVKKYVIYTRLYLQDRRWIGRTESEDFENWSPVFPVIGPGLDAPLDHDYYLNGYTFYPGLPEYRLMFPMVYYRSTERSDIRLFSSEDGSTWNEIPGGPVISPGEYGRWDSEFIGSGKDFVPFIGDRIAIPYSGTRYPHKYPRWKIVWDAWKWGWALWQKDRICAVVADGDGEFWTRPILPAGQRIFIDYTTTMSGEIRVGVEGLKGFEIEHCNPLTGDQKQPVRWKNSMVLKIPDGTPIVLHIRMRSAKLFSIEFK